MSTSKSTPDVAQLQTLVGREAIYHESFCLCHVRLERVGVSDQGAQLTLGVIQGICAWPENQHSTTIGSHWDMMAFNENMVWTTSVPWWLNLDPAVVSAVVRIHTALPELLSGLDRYRTIRRQLAAAELAL